MFQFNRPHKCNLANENKDVSGGWGLKGFSGLNALKPVLFSHLCLIKQKYKKKITKM